MATINSTRLKPWDLAVPGRFIDSQTVRLAGRQRMGRLLKGGVKVYEYEPTMYHCKVMIVDQLLVSVGSTNFDNRSFRLNDEANLNVYDAQFAQRQTRVFEDDIRRSRRVTYEDWLNRPLREKVHEKMTAVLRSQL